MMDAEQSITNKIHEAASRLNECIGTASSLGLVVEIETRTMEVLGRRRPRPILDVFVLRPIRPGREEDAS